MIQASVNKDMKLQSLVIKMYENCGAFGVDSALSKAVRSLDNGE